MDIGNQSGKTFVITGANSGLGYESMKQIMLAGGHVVMGCRSQERAMAAIEKVKKETNGKGGVEFVRLDLADLDSVKEFADNIKKDHAKIDCLMNNAGVMFTERVKTKQGFDMQMGTNHFGHFALTMHLLPSLRAADKPRVVTVSSMMALRIMPGGGWIDFDDIHCDKRFNTYVAYGHSKFANLVFHYELAKRLEGTNIIAVAAHPGYTATELQRNSIFRYINPLLAMKVSQGARPQILAATGSSVKSGDYYGPYFWSFGSPCLAGPPYAAKDFCIRERFWSLSEKETGVSFPL
eukprot:TRINITY_DN6532_c0_g2_i2.p1 TRINITY_DN6532_c0_g2~~TRINITY_DN6532_c0_g2_i2.p1  ORF type:complete len:294 (+),score=80.12 TRINITY_DN6532_c0_g2_i2:41-922(+)